MHYKKLCPRQKQGHICSPTFYAASYKKDPIDLCMCTAYIHIVFLDVFYTQHT